MKKIISSIIFIFSIALLSIFITILVSENSNIVSYLYKDKIVKEVEDKISLNVNFNDLRVKWEGLNPQLIFDDLSLYSKKDNSVILKSDSFTVDFDSFDSIRKQRLVIKEVDFIKTDLNIIINDNKFILNEIDLSELLGVKKNNIMTQTRLRISQSKLFLNYLSNEYSFDNISVVLFKKRDNYKIFSTFTHNDDNQLVHIAADLKHEEQNKISGSFFSQGVNISANNYFRDKNLKLEGTDINYEVWLELDKNKITNLSGSMNLEKLNVFRNDKKNPLVFSKSSFNYEYLMDSQKRYINIQELKTNINKKVYSNNEISLKFINNNLEDIFIKEINLDTVKDIIIKTNLKFNRNLNQALSNFMDANFSNIYISDLNNSKKFNYSLEFKNLDAALVDEYYVNNLDGHLFGDAVRSYVRISSKDVIFGGKNDYRQKYNSLDANVLINEENDGYQIKTDTINLADVVKIKLDGYFGPKNHRYRIKASGSLDTLLQDNFFPNIYEDVIRQSKLNSRYVIEYNELRNDKNKYNFGKVIFSDFIYKSEEYAIFGSSDNITVNFLNNYIISKPSKLKLNQDNFNFRVFTTKQNNVLEYTLQGIGNISTKSLKETNLFGNLDYLDGSALSKLSLKFMKSGNSTNVTMILKSDMKGMSLDLFEPFAKRADDKKNLFVKYNITNNKKRYVDITFEDYDMRLYYQKGDAYLNVSSPSLQGSIIIPAETTQENRLFAKLQYFNMNDFQGSADPSIYPHMEISINRVRIGNSIFNNMKLSSFRSRDGMTLDQLSFQNKNLSMNASGKWVNVSGNQITFFDGNFSSSNFGKSLKELGYGDIIKRGKLNSRMIGQWKGSPDLFSLENFAGSITVSMTDGEFLQIQKETKVIGQLLGLFSIASLQKRLSLDFSDFFSSGLSFDKMNGEFLFEKSIASVNNLNLSGTFGEMNISGTSNIKQQTHDQKLTYIPDLSSMSLISGTLLGGPIGAVASIFYDKVLKEIGIDTNELAAVEYTIKGSWKNPEINLVETFKPIKN